MSGNARTTIVANNQKIITLNKFFLFTIKILSANQSTDKVLRIWLK